MSINSPRPRRPVKADFESLVTAIEDYAIFMLDPEGRVLTWNRGAELIKGYSAGEILGQHVSCLYPPEDVAAGKPQRDLEEAAAHGRFEEEGWCLRKDGSRFWANTVITPLYGPGKGAGGPLRGFAKVTRDLTQRKRAEERLLREQVARAEAEGAARRLAALQAITDAALGTNLPPDELLHELLGRLRTLLEADTAAVLLLDERGENLEVAAASGLEEGLKEKVPVPVGRGFAGRIAATRQPLILEDTSEIELVSSVLRDNICSLMGVPLQTDGRLIGVLDVGTRMPRAFSQGEMVLLSLVADRATAAIERARAFAALEQSRAEAEAARERLHTVLMRAPLPIFIQRGPEHIFEFANPPTIEILGRAELIGKRPVEALPEIDPRMVALLDKVYETGERFVGQEFPIKFAYSATGYVERFWNFVHEPLKDAQGHVESIMTIVSEVTDQVLARRALERFFMQVPAAVAVFEGPRHMFRMANPRFREIVGEHCLGKPIADVLPQAAAGLWIPLLDRVFQTGETIERREYDSLLLPGRYFDSVLQPLRDTTGDITGVLHFSVDVTDRIQATRALRESEEQFRQLADAMPQIVWAARPDGRTDYFNQRWYEFIGQGLDEGQNGGDGWLSVLHHDDAERCMGAWYESVKSGQPYQIEYRFWDRRERRYRWFLGRALPVHDSAGQIIRWYGTSTDIDDQKHAEEAMRAALRVRDEFLSMASHELRTPVTTLDLLVDGMMRALERPGALPPERLATKLQTLRRQADRLEHLVDGLLDVSRIMSGRLELELGDVDLMQVVSEVITMLGDQAAHAGSPIRIKAAGPVLGRWDRVRLEQVAVNLITNAIKYGAGKPIDVSLTADGETAVLTVRDQGIGIAPEDQRRIFGRFERAAPRKNYGGLGLGLWITAQIVHTMGGTISVSSQLGQGATFTIRLPCQGSSVLIPVAEPA
ncbi:MAG TPA: PAS domain-containing protein [Polyangia bacterium]|jgi:PAS domain S-box-containing protein|nr:PAS domain-containing protein [Polyangia bacterium]